MKKPFYKLDSTGDVELKIYKNSACQEFYVTSDENLPEGCTFVDTVKASKYKCNPQTLQVATIPAASTDSIHNLDYKEVDLRVIIGIYNGNFELEPSFQIPLICDDLAIIVEESSKLNHVIFSIISPSI